VSAAHRSRRCSDCLKVRRPRSARSANTGTEKATPSDSRARRFRCSRASFQLAQTVEVFVRDFGVEMACEMAVSRSGSWFDPALVKLLLSLRSDREFWRSVQDERTIVDLGLLEPNEMQIVEDEERLDRVAEAFALVIDAKSPYTYRHTTRVAELAVAAGSALDMDRDALRELRRAGFLHDIGKLAVPTRSSTSPAG
jgi:hypothetical protein